MGRPPAEPGLCLTKRIRELHRRKPEQLAKREAKCAARSHRPVQLAEAVEQVMVRNGPGKVFVDCTFGRGGHTKEMLSRLFADGKLVAFDIDPSAVRAGKMLEAEDERFEILHRPFGDLAEAVAEAAGVLLDLGVSSPQLDDARRGFSFKNKKDGPLDLRMNQQTGMPASEWLQTVKLADLASIIKAVGYDLDPLLVDEISQAILQHQQVHGPFATTLKLASFLEQLELQSGFQQRHPGLSLVHIVFYAIRVFLNQEISQLVRVLEGAFQCLEMYGRCVVITFNRWEALSICKFLQSYDETQSEELETASTGTDFCVRRVMKPLRPSQEELCQNQRARSSLLHVLEKVPRACQPDSQSPEPHICSQQGHGVDHDSEACLQAPTRVPLVPVHLPRGWGNVGAGEKYVEPLETVPPQTIPVSVEQGILVNIVKEGLASESDVNQVLLAFGRGRGGFRRFGDRRILDFKFMGVGAARLIHPFDVLNPLLRALIVLAEQSLEAGEGLALLQLLVNYYKDGSNKVLPHVHRCRHICCSLGATRDVEVEGRRVSMAHGDCLPLRGEVHGVPEVAEKTRARVSVCLFYASTAEFDAGTVGVPAREGCVYWSHPQDQLAEKKLRAKIS